MEVGRRGREGKGGHTYIYTSTHETPKHARRNLG